jgi:hypothetical protein
MADKTAEFLPFHAINEFMRLDYRLTVIRSALGALPSLPDRFRAPIEKLTRQHIRVAGFRNSAQAPAPLKVPPMAEGFEKHPALVAAILAAWAEAHIDLRARMYELLTSRGWEILPADADRTKLPGFHTHWPKDQDFDVLNRAYTEAHPDDHVTSDDISLMVVWLSGRLPYHVEGQDEQDGSGSDETAPSS